jgi:hypothetical protein
MTVQDRQSRFELVADELRALGITIRSSPGEYCINYRDGGEATAQRVDDLDEALAIGRAMAADPPAPAPRFQRRWRRRRSVIKPRRRRKLRRRTRKAPGQTFRKPPEEG